MSLRFMDLCRCWVSRAYERAHFAQSALLLIASIALFLMPMLCAAGVSKSDALLLKYSFDEHSGAKVIDSSGRGLDGDTVGEARQVPGIIGRALELDGTARIQVPEIPDGRSPFSSVSNALTITAWIRGRGGPFRMISPPSTNPSLRGPDFQVLGNVVHFVASSDNPATDPTRKRIFPWDGWDVWTGTYDVNLTKWVDQRRTTPPFGGVEPKLVVVAGRIFYVWFGWDASGVFQIFHAQANSDGSDWRAVQRTYIPAGYKTEQDFNIQVVDGRIYYAWMQKDAADVWQAWTGVSDIDGSNYKARQLTTGGAGIPRFQVVGDRIYFLYPTDRIRKMGGKPLSRDLSLYQDSVTIASSRLDGSDHRILKLLPNTSTGAFHVTNSRVFLRIARLSEDGYLHLYTATMDVDGGNYREQQRTLGRTNVGGSAGGDGIQVVGQKIHYAFTVDDSGVSVPESYASLSRTKQRSVMRSLWTAEADLDGQNWRATRRTDLRSDLFLGYQGLQVVGGKSYFAAFESPPAGSEASERGDRYRPLIGAMGSNLINKGSAWGVGITSDGVARAFVDAGQESQFRGTAPEDSSGATAEGHLEAGWRFLVSTYDQKELKLYIDGKLINAVPYTAPIYENPFPLMIGDGFVGAVDEVLIYNRVMSAEEIAKTHRRYAKQARNSGSKGCCCEVLLRQQRATAPCSKF